MLRFTGFWRIKADMPDSNRRSAMIDKSDTERRGGDAGRQTRLRAALRENLKRRKSQSRGRADRAAAEDRHDSDCRDD
jgi:hypothetical protein